MSIVRRVINLPATGVVVTGVSGKKIRVLALAAYANAAAGGWKFQSSPQTATGTDEEYTGPADLTGNMWLGASSTTTGSLILPYNPVGWFETRESDDLVGYMVSGNAIEGCIVCEMVDA